MENPIAELFKRLDRLQDTAAIERVISDIGDDGFDEDVLMEWAEECRVVIFLFRNVQCPEFTHKYKKRHSQIANIFPLLEKRSNYFHAVECDEHFGVARELALSFLAGMSGQQDLEKADHYLRQIGSDDGDPDDFEELDIDVLRSFMVSGRAKLGSL